MPRLTAVGSDTTRAAIAFATSTRPEPCSNAVSFGLAVVAPDSTALSRAPVQSGFRWARSAAAPATCGVAIDVPDSAVYPSATGSPMVPAECSAATMPTPGAVTSGLIAPSILGPRLEKPAMPSVRSIAPTVSAASALPGESIVRSPGPALPAATTNSVPYRADSVSTASSSGSVPSRSGPPRLRFAMSAPCSAAHRIPAMMSDSVP